MKLLTRYVIREHVGPLLFALSALTSLLMLQYVARQLANLAGKGLPLVGHWAVLRAVAAIHHRHDHAHGRSGGNALCLWPYGGRA